MDGPLSTPFSLHPVYLPVFLPLSPLPICISSSQGFISALPHLVSFLLMLSVSSSLCFFILEMGFSCNLGKYTLLESLELSVILPQLQLLGLQM